MTDTCTLASAPCQALWRGTPVGPAEVSRPHESRAIPRGIIATWRERMRFRRKLEQMSKTSPHLIDDIGLTSRQVEAEIAKRFWQR
jgi:uncharacterized protein YjiS (DUF1127 family)